MTKRPPIEAALQNSPLFHSVERTSLESFLKEVEVFSVPAGKALKDRTDGDALYFLVSGMASITKRLPSGKESVLGRLQAGDLFGGPEPAGHTPHSTEIYAVTDCQLCRIEKKDFSSLLQASPQFRDNLLTMLSLRLHESDTFLSDQLGRMHTLIEAAKIVNSSLDIDTLLEVILNTAAASVQADRGTLYLLDKEKSELWSKVQQGSAKIEIRLPVGKGIAGTVAQSGATFSITDAYRDPRFNPDIDRTSGYHTHTILCMPMKNKEGNIIGVFQLLNKAHGPFTAEDEKFIEALSVHASIAIENAQLAQQMVQSERLSAVGKMASSIIHDIKNPLGTIRLYAQLIKQQSENKEINKMTDDMVNQVDRFINMTQEVLDFSRGISSVNIQPLNVPDLMLDAFAFLEKNLERHSIVLKTHVKFNDRIYADQEKLTRVFHNIINNAIDAMPEGGALTVNVFRQAHHLVIEFSDTGVGIPEHIRHMIFQPFVTHGKKHGTGLGMAIVKKIMDDHQGTVEVDSEPGRGTTIRLRLPIREGKA